LHIVRFLDPAGCPQLGADQGDHTAALIPAAEPTTGPLTPTGETAPIARRLAPVAPVAIYCIGLNYRRHASETGAPVPEHPVLFMKPPSAVIGAGEPIRLPACQKRGPEVDFEGELAVIIGRPGRDIPEAEALTHIAGYTIGHDVSARRWQKEGGGGQFVRGKSFDTFCPLGPVMVTPDELPDPQALSITTTLNDQVMQQSTTGDMIFTVAQLIAFLSQDTTLQPGTVILTGTPEGVGFARNPPVFLKQGDTVSITIDGLGTLTNPVMDAANDTATD
jgi:2-keto-4-pentenoate hydratase/2-oxohepta-3-ene-1,7-dioic acid hydratase in catechol pathway